MRSTAALADATSPTLASEIIGALGSLGRAPGPNRLARGEMVSLHDGRRGSVHLLARGRVKILRFSDEGRVILLDLVEAGEVFGELAGIGAPPDGTMGSCYAEALEETFVYSIPCPTFERLLVARPGLALRIVGVLGERCHKLERRLEAHVFQKVPVRLGNQLLELAERYGVAEEGGTLLPVPLSQQDLGNLIGASREIVSLTLSDFKRRGLVSSRGRRLVVREDRIRDEISH